MRKAYVGFSTPVGYDYKNSAQKTESDMGSSPNPILVGATGLFTLFDEIWFPCRSICPQSMRNLHYVRFVSEECSHITIDESQAKVIARDIPTNLSLNDLYPEGGYNEFMNKFYGQIGPDNHTHGIRFFDQVLGGNPSTLNLVWDLMILEELGEGFTPVLNGLTRQYSFPEGMHWLRNENEDSAIRATDKILSISSIYDITGPSGPYHPVLEELRDHDYVKSFRNWIRGETNSLHNKSPNDVAAEINEVINEFGKTSLRDAVGKDGIREVSIELLEGISLDLVPGSSTVKTVCGLYQQQSELELRKASAFVAESRGLVWNASANSRIHFS